MSFLISDFFFQVLPLFKDMPRKVNRPSPSPSDEEWIESLEDSGEEYVPPRKAESESECSSEGRGRLKKRSSPSEKKQRDQSPSRKRRRSPEPSPSPQSQLTPPPPSFRRRLFEPTVTPSTSVVPPTPATTGRTLSGGHILPGKTAVTGGTHRPEKHEKAKGKSREQRHGKCIFGCKKHFKGRLVRHYTGKKHGLTLEEARMLAMESKPAKTSTGRYRRICPEAGIKDTIVAAHGQILPLT